MSKLFLSIIVPVYNVEGYLNQCVESVLSQSFTNFELILVDDGSTDSSGEICDQYMRLDNRIRVLHKTNGGLSSARNAGLSQSQGEYVIFLDSDDFWIDSKFIEEVYNKCLSTKYDVIRAEYKLVDNFGNYISSPSVTGKQRFVNSSFGSYEMVASVMSGGSFSWLFVIKKELAYKVSFNEDVKFQEDIDFSVRLFANDLQCGYIPMQFYAYRQRPGSIMAVPKLENLCYSFSFCDLFYDSSQLIKDCRLRELYVYNGIMMYCWTIKTVSEDYYYYQLDKLNNLIDLNGLRKRVLSRKHLVKNYSFPIQLFVHPYLYVYLLRLKHKLNNMKRLFL